MNVNAQKFQSLQWPVGNHWHESTIERHSLSQPLRTASSLREGAGKRPHNVNHPPAGCFVSGRVIFGLCVGVMFCHSSGYLRNRGVGGRFSSPLRNSETFYRLRSSDDTPSASLRSAAPSEREPGTVGLYHSSCRSETGMWRAIFIAPTKRFSFHHASCCFRAGGVRAGCIGWRLRCRAPGGGPFVPGGG